MTETELRNLARTERLAYFKAWRTSNKDRVRRYNSTYWERRAQKKLEKKFSNNEGTK